MSQPNEQHFDLSPNDQRLLDALVECGFDRQAMEPLTAAERQRVDVILGMVGLLNDYPVEDCDPTLVHATLARVDRYESAQADRMNLNVRMEQAADEGGRRRIRLPDFITVAAMILIAVGVLWPVMNSVRSRSIDMRCANNMRMIGFALDQYAADYNGAMPMAAAGLNSAWDAAANVLNLRPLVDSGLCEEGHLNCPGHHAHGPSYSCRMQGANEPIGWGIGRVTIALGDANPLIEGFLNGRNVPPLSMSLNHGGRGQNVLASDGATMWLEQPMIGQDNIWLPKGASQLVRGLRPAEVGDVFLTH